jgi:hypothetical protein
MCPLDLVPTPAGWSIGDRAGGCMIRQAAPEFEPVPISRDGIRSGNMTN